MNIKTFIKKSLKAVSDIVKEEKIRPIPQPINVQKCLEGKVALITGGSGGLGMAIAESFIRSGCKVIIAGTNEQKLTHCVEKLNSENEKMAALIVLNVLEVKTMSQKICEAAACFNENRIDILVNSAGVHTQLDFFHMSEEEYDSIMDINVKGTYFLSQAMGLYMINNHIKGHILNISSSSALRPAANPYQLSKWAIKGFTLGGADSLLPYGIIMNAIAPGPTATAMLDKNSTDNIALIHQPSGRYAMPSEIASLATYMVSDMGNLIVGDTFYITGGSGTIDIKH